MDIQTRGCAPDVAELVAQRVREGADLLAHCAPTQARWVRRYVRTVSFLDLRAVSTVMRRDGLVLGEEYVAASSPPGIALTLVYAALLIRLHPIMKRRTGADALAQYWRRVHGELRIVARAFDQSEDATGYIPGISTGQWELWVDGWVGHAALRPRAAERHLRRILRDLRRLGAPKWLRRCVTVWLNWRWRAV